MGVEQGRKILFCILLSGAALGALAQDATMATDSAEVGVADTTADEVADETGLSSDQSAADQSDERPARSSGTAIVPGSELESMTAPMVRMVLSLAAVLALVGIFAWLAKRFRGAQLQGGLIQIVGGLSLGPKDRVVLLRVGEEEVLVGLSPSGMRQLHVMNKPSAKFSLDLADTERQD
ncbi:MAG: flagellar biosynthetic protein FliO [Gammaproteobacteria bacterium]|nr:flagellar biosynthetic protein FliO [Gammaproteobacteria bacterium]